MDALPALDRQNRWIALVVLCVGMLMIILDATVVNVALPAIQTDLGFSQSSLAWVVNAYLIPFGGLLLLAGRLGDLLGRRSIFLTGLTVFVAASLACGLAQSSDVLIAARFIQGIGGAMTSAVILGMIVTMFPEPVDRAKAIGIYSFTAAAGGSIGLLAGGILTESLSWHWIFFINLPIGIVTGVLAVRLLERDQGIGLAHGADVPGAVLVTGSLMLGVYTIVGAADIGWGAPRTLILAAVSVALLAGFVLRESRARNPLMPLRIFRSRNVVGANSIQIFMVAGLFATFFLGALYLQEVQGFDPVQVGLAFLPVSVSIGGMSLFVSPRLITRIGARATLIPGLVLIAAGLAWFAHAPVDGRYAQDVLPAVIALGIGAGLGFPALMTLAMSGATPEDSGLASGLVNTTQQVGGALGLAVLATLSSGRASTLRDGGSSEAAALTGGFHLAFVVGAGLALAGLALAFTVLESQGAGATQTARDRDTREIVTEA